MKSINVEDTIFILNMRIRLIRDTLRLNPPPELFLEKSLDDLVFIDHVLAVLSEAILESGNFDNLPASDTAADTEWQFNQLLTEFSLDSSPFSAYSFPEIQVKIAELRDGSNVRRKALEESGSPAEAARSEPVVSSAELSGLLGSV
ncbi:MAG: hypothetical protein FWH38_05625 [Treponema sp.]|nr:hypothetical protein [Treponema sp.]